MVADALARLLRNPSPTCYRSRGVQYSSFMWDYIPIFVKSPWFRSAVIISLPSVSIWKVGQYNCLPRSIWWTLHPKTTLQWRHNEHNGVSNHQPYDCLLNRLFRRKSNKTSKLCVTGFCEGNAPVTGEFPEQRASNAENVSMWWRHHESSIQLKSWFLYIRTLGGGGYLLIHILHFSSKSHSYYGSNGIRQHWCYCGNGGVPNRSIMLIWDDEQKRIEKGNCRYHLALIHWGRVTHLCVGNLTIIDSDNGLSPERRQAIIWTSTGILLNGP